MSYKTEQENFWAGKFGDEYIGRNQGEATVASNTALFSKILKSTNSISSVIEFGANIGLNLEAIKRLLPKVELSAIEINEEAVVQLKKKQDIKVFHLSFLDFSQKMKWI